MELKTARRIARLTQQELAEKVGVDHSLISMLESGKRDIHMMAYQTVVRIARVLGVDPEELWPVPPLSDDETDPTERSA
jgi:transcriptional regulator with XRE-family HTH domain